MAHNAAARLSASSVSEYELRSSDGRTFSQFEYLNRDIQVWTIKDNYRLGSDINSKVLAFAFGLSAEIERNLISQRTKEALARKKAEGIILGRPKGRKSSKTKLTGQEKKIQELLDKKVSYSAIGRILGVHRLTVSSFVKQRLKSVV